MPLVAHSAQSPLPSRPLLSPFPCRVVGRRVNIASEREESIGDTKNNSSGEPRTRQAWCWRRVDPYVPLHTRPPPSIDGSEYLGEASEGCSVCTLNECCKVLEELKTRTDIQLVIRVSPGVSQPLSPPLHNPSQQAPRAGPKREPSRSHDQRSLALISVASDSSNSSRRPPSRHLRVGSSLASLHSQ